VKLINLDCVGTGTFRIRLSSNRGNHPASALSRHRGDCFFSGFFETSRIEELGSNELQPVASNYGSHFRILSLARSVYVSEYALIEGGIPLCGMKREAREKQLEKTVRRGSALHCRRYYIRRLKVLYSH